MKKPADMAGFLLNGCRWLCLQHLGDGIAQGIYDIDAGDSRIEPLRLSYSTLAMASHRGSMLARVIPATLIRPEPTI